MRSVRGFRILQTLSDFEKPKIVLISLIKTLTHLTVIDNTDDSSISLSGAVRNASASKAAWLVDLEPHSAAHEKLQPTHTELLTQMSIRFSPYDDLPHDAQDSG